MAAALRDAAPPRARKQHDDLSGDEEEEGEGEEGEYRAASELSSPNPHSLFGDVGDDDDGDDSDVASLIGPSDDEGDYAVQRVVGARLVDGGWQYRVRWAVRKCLRSVITFERRRIYVRKLSCMRSLHRDTLIEHNFLIQIHSRYCSRYPKV